MGLDMYLDKVKKDESFDESFEVAYWRKANAIHAWFERNCANGELEDCQDYNVSKDDLIKLVEDCQTVLNSSKLVEKEVPVQQYDFDKKDYVEVKKALKVLDDTSVAEELLPTQSGFFFGSTLYDQYYVEDLENTVKQITEILKDTDFDEWNIVYHAWW